MKLRRDSHVAMHRQLAQHLRGAIGAGKYRAGDRLPTGPDGTAAEFMLYCANAHNYEFALRLRGKVAITPAMQAVA
jgi:hypothetical protein